MNDQNNGLLAPVWEAIGELRDVQLKHVVAPNALRLGPNITLHGSPEQRVAFFAALAKAQAAYEPIARTRTVEVKSDRGNYTFDYAPLEEVISATMPALNANGLAWLCVPTEGQLHTMLTHCDGAMLHSVEPLPAFDSPQKYGSALTYRRRYGYQCITGTSPEYDDDGNAAQGNQVQAMQQKRREPPAPAQGRGTLPGWKREPNESPDNEGSRLGPQRPAPANPKPAPKPAAAAQPPAPRPASVPPPASEPPRSAPPPAPVEEPPPPTDDDAPGAPTVVDPGNREASQEQADSVIALAKELRWDRNKLNAFIGDRITPGRVYTNLTFAEAAALIPMLEGQVKRG